MNTTPSSNERFAFSSSITGDGWHPQKDPKSYEWWYFDALSDDGTEAVAITFLDNFIYSPRYNRPENGSSQVKSRFPAVSFTYFAGGKRIYRAESEFDEAEFSAKAESPECRIGNSSFRYDSTSYGSGYLVSVDLPISRGRRLVAELEWVSIESDFRSAPFCYNEAAHCWNMVAPRADVSGKITVVDRNGKTIETRSFRGTGYHDHNLDNRWLANTVKHWSWGRAHFTDATVVFYRYAEIGDDDPQTRLLLIKGGELVRREVTSVEQDFVRDRFGIKYPTRLFMESDDGLRIEARPLKIIDSSFYHLRFLSSIAFSGDGREHQTTGISEFIAPRALKYRWLDWLTDLRTGRNGRASRI